MIFRNQGSLIKKSNTLSREELIDLYGSNSYEFTQTNKEEIFVCSKNKDLDLIELDQPVSYTHLTLPTNREV